MADSTVTAGELTIGLDVGDKRTHLCVLDHQTGEVVEEGAVQTTKAALRRRLGGYGRARVALEVGPHSRWLSALLGELGHEVLVANARKVRLITDNDTKTDRLDAMRLALLARADPRLLHPVVHRGPKAQADLAVLKARDLLVGQRTRLVNHVRGVLKGAAIRVPKCSTRVFPAKARECLTDELRPALEPLLDHLVSLTKAIKDYDRKIGELAATEYPETKALRQVTGVGPLTALAFVLVLEDPVRFRNGRALASYLGLRPRKHQSGDPDPDLRITKAGNGFLRRLLVSSAHYVLGPFGPDCDLRRWGEKLAGRGGRAAKKRAVVAVARKLAVLLYTLWLSKEDYDPFRTAQATATATAAQASERTKGVSPGVSK